MLFLRPQYRPGDRRDWLSWNCLATCSTYNFSKTLNAILMKIVENVVILCEPNFIKFLFNLDVGLFDASGNIRISYIGLFCVVFVPYVVAIKHLKIVLDVVRAHCRLGPKIIRDCNDPTHSVDSCFWIWP